MRWFLVSLAIAACTSGGPPGSADAHHVRGRRAPQATRSPTPSPLPVLGAAPAFSYIDQEGRPLTDGDLVGHVWIADFIFTSCTNVCPMLSARMAMLQRRIADPSVRFVSFSVDPAHDTPAVLAAYAARWRKDETRWRLLATGMATLGAVAHGLRATLAPGMTPAEPLVHSADFTLVDAAGFVRGVYASEDAGDLARLVADATALASHAAPAAGSPVAGPVTGTDGMALYAALGCAGCHADPRIAPPLEGLFGKRVALDDDRTVTADAAYLRESIVDPRAKVVDGYPTAMPSYAALLDGAQLDALVAYLAALRGGPGVAAARHVAVDPVCRMAVSVGAETPHASYGGVTYSFCSEICRTRFRESPALYAGPAKK